MTGNRDRSENLENIGKYFYLTNLKVVRQLPTKPKNEGAPTQGHVVIQVREMNFKNKGD